MGEHKEIMTRHECPLSNRDVESVQQLRETLSELMNAINMQKIDIHKIKAAVVGDEYNDGLKQRLERAEDAINTQKKMQWGIIGVGTFLGLVSGFRVVAEIFSI